MRLLPTPQFCSVASTYSADDPGMICIPTLTTRYYSHEDNLAPSLERFGDVTGASLEFVPCETRRGYTTLIFTPVHDCVLEDCPTLMSRIAFDLPDAEMDEFLAVYEQHNSFLWLCSTPEYMGRAVFNKSTKRVVSKSSEGRCIH